MGRLGSLRHQDLSFTLVTDGLRTLLNLHVAHCSASLSASAVPHSDRARSLLVSRVQYQGKPTNARADREGLQLQLVSSFQVASSLTTLPFGVCSTCACGLGEKCPTDGGTARHPSHY